MWAFAASASARLRRICFGRYPAPRSRSSNSRTCLSLRMLLDASFIRSPFGCTHWPARDRPSLSPLWVKISAKGHPASLWPRNQRSPFIVGTVNDLPGEDEFLTVKDRFDLLIAYAMLHVPLAGKRPSLMESGERDGFDSRNSWIGSRSA